MNTCIHAAHALDINALRTSTTLSTQNAFEDLFHSHLGFLFLMTPPIYIFFKLIVESHSFVVIIIEERTYAMTTSHFFFLIFFDDSS